jgi:hypothetical protein
MGFLEKRNPRATRRSVIAWAFGCGVIGSLVGLIGGLQPEMPSGAVFFFVPWMTVGGAIAGAAIEWQMEG